MPLGGFITWGFDSGISDLVGSSSISAMAGFLRPRSAGAGMVRCAGVGAVYRAGKLLPALRIQLFYFPRRLPSTIEINTSHLIL